MSMLIGMTSEELEGVVAEIGEKRFRAAQIKKWLNRGARFEDMTDLPEGLRKKLRAGYGEGYPECLERLGSEDGTRKYLFGLADGNTVESVYLPKAYGSSVCVSTQVGCAMGCAFCASCAGGLVRNLDAGEILAQVVRINADNGGAVDHIVLMGMGEPLDNYENVVKFIKLANAADGLNIGIRNISLSTCGIVDKIYSFADEGMGVTLSVSLHASTQEKRLKVMPSARKYGIGEIITAAKYYFEKTGRRVIIEYALIEGFNDSDKDIAELAGLLRGFSCHINVIPLNEWGGLRPPKKRDVYAFAERLEKAGLSATVRRSMGSDIKGACGQLRQKKLCGG